MKDKLSSKKKVLLIGPFPPPYGGVSVHILRFKNLLKEEFAFDFIDESRDKKNEIFNIRSLNIFRYLQKINHSDVVYIHSGSNLLRIFHLFVARLLGKKIILVLHGFTSSPPKIIFYVKGVIYRLATTIIVVNEDIKKRLYLPEKKCVTKEAFIPPLLTDEPPLPENIAKLVCRSRDGDKVVICANAFRLEKYKDQDLYGLDMCIEVAKRLLQKEHSFIFIYIVSSIDDKAVDYIKMQQLITDLNLSDHFFLTNEKLSFVKLMQDSDIIVRPTNTDGDSLTIREGLFLNKKVLASDVVERPKGVVLFQNRNFDDLEIKLADLIRNKNIHSENTSQENRKQNENFKKYYCDLINSL